MGDLCELKYLILLPRFSVMSKVPLAANVNSMVDALLIPGDQDALPHLGEEQNEESGREPASDADKEVLQHVQE